MSNVVVDSFRDEDDACADPLSSQDNNDTTIPTDATNNTNTNKKKNNNKKKKKKGSMVDRVVSSIGANDSNVLWVRLNSCRLGDHHMSSLCAALEKNTHVLSLDLSDNEITERGLGMLCDCLCEGGASDMIELDVRGNTVGCREDVDRMLEKMMNVRKVVHVMVDGDLRGTCSNSSTSSSSSSSSSDENVGEGLAVSSGEYSQIVQQVFDVTRGQDDTDAYSGVEEENAALWEEVTYSVAKHDATMNGTLMLPSLSSSLFSLNEYIQSELTGYKLPLLEDTSLEDLHSCISLTLEHVHVLDRILDFQVVPAFQTQYHKEVIVPRLGSHRILAVTLAASTLKADCPCISEAFAKTRILEKALCLSLQFPSCSIMHVQCLQMARVAVSPHSIRVGLWKQLVASRNVWDSIGNILQSLPSPDTGCAHRQASAVSGMLAGFCIELVHLLVHHADEEPPSSASSTTSASGEDGKEIAASAAVQQAQKDLKAALESMPQWKQTTLLVESLMEVQRKHLGGTPPPRTHSFDSFNDSMNFSGPQLLALLQGLTLQQPSSSE